MLEHYSAFRKKSKCWHLWEHDLHACLTIMSLLFHGPLPHHIHLSNVASSGLCPNVTPQSHLLQIASLKIAPFTYYPHASLQSWAHSRGFRNTLYMAFSFFPPSLCLFLHSCLLGSLCTWTPSVQVLDGSSFWGNANFREPLIFQDLSITTTRVS